MKMVRAVALAAAIGAATVAGAAAQPVIGFRLGVGMAKASIEDSEGDLSWLTTFIGGGFIRFGAGQIAIQPELMYVTKGAKSDETATEPEIKFKQDYVEVPVLLFLGLGTGAATPYIVVGPAFAFEVKCKLEASEGSTSADVDCDDPELGELAIETKKFDVGAMFGAGLAFPAGPGSIVLDGRFNLGLMNVIDDEDPDGGSLKHRMLSFTAGYQIPLGIR